MLKHMVDVGYWLPRVKLFNIQVGSLKYLGCSVLLCVRCANLWQD